MIRARGNPTLNEGEANSFGREWRGSKPISRDIKAYHLAYLN
jgi:hypothetical protein